MQSFFIDPNNTNYSINNLQTKIGIFEKKIKVSVTDFGAKGDYYTNDTLAFKNAIQYVSSRGGGVVYIPIGEYKIEEELVIPTPYSIDIIGESRERTILRFNTDLGVGKYAIRSLQRQCTLREFTVRGPSKVDQLGVAPASMNGIRLGDTMTVDRVASRGFYAAGEVVDNHVIYTDCYFGASYYGLYWGESTSAGDHRFINCDLSGNKFASIGIGKGRMLGTTFIGTHFGFSPYGIYIENVTNTLPMGTVTFIQSPLEHCGMGAIYDEGFNKTVENLNFIGTGTIISDSYKLPNRTLEANMKIYTIRNLKTDYAGILNTRYGEPSIKCNAIYNSEINGTLTPYIDCERAANGGLTELTLKQGNIIAKMGVADAYPVEKGQILRRGGGYGKVAPYASSVNFYQPIGVALNDAVAGGVVSYAISGIVRTQLDTTDSISFSGGNLLTVSSANKNKVMAIARTGEIIKPVIGSVNASPGSNTLVEVDLNISL